MSECLPSRDKPFVVAIDKLEYDPRLKERRVKLWTEIISGGHGYAPIKVAEIPGRPGNWRVYSGAEAVEAARRLGRTEMECSLR